MKSKIIKNAKKGLDDLKECINEINNNSKKFNIDYNVEEDEDGTIIVEISTQDNCVCQDNWDYYCQVTFDEDENFIDIDF